MLRKVRRPSLSIAVEPVIDSLEARTMLAVSPISLSLLGSYKTGVFDEGAAEIVAHDPRTQRLFVINAQASTVDILDIRNPKKPTLFKTIDTSDLGSPNSVAVHDGVVAVALENEDQQAPGKVGFFNARGELISAVTVGALPDMLTFTPDGKYVLAANEGQPNEQYTIDPEGSVSIIPVPNGMGNLKKLKDSAVKTASFAQFNGQESALRAMGIRITGPNATAAKDFEPEYITVSEDSKTAYVTLQENNAVAVIDIKSAKVQKLLPLGLKNYNQAPTTQTFTFENMPSIGSTTAGQELKLGGFSGLAFEGYAANGNMKFIAHTDRGPNGEPNAAGQRPFLLPGFNPEIVRFELNPTTGQLTLTQRIGLKRADGTPITGLPNTAISNNTNQPYNDEVPIDLFGNTVGLDPVGGDFEGIAVDSDGSFWMCDEYRPAIYHFAPDGKLIERFVPIGTAAAAGQPAGTFGTEALPAVLGQRRQNRGFEGIAFQNGKVYAIVQSPIRNPVTLSNATLNGLRNVRLVEFDPATKATRQFLYAMDNPASTSADDTRADKIGDMTALPGGGFMLVERDDDAIDSDPLATITKKVYGFGLAGATVLTPALDKMYDVTRKDAAGNDVVVSLSVDQMTAAELRTVASITVITKTLHVDLATAGYNTVEKVEGIALIDADTIAVINDNDFGVAGITIDNVTGTYTLNPGYVPEPVVLGLVHTPGFDASDRDNFINVRNWPVMGMYMPDTIASYTVGGKTYFITANEGDARAYAAFNEEVRVGASAYKLDPTAFPNAAELKANNNLGRLTVTNASGDTDGDGDFDQIHLFGTRSFSIWSSDGVQVFDSGSDFERITAELLPAVFNASNANNNFDDRSDNKGPEPEGLELAVIDGKTYAFIGLERIGGVMVYDVTNPVAPKFVEYVNNRDFTKDPATQTLEAGDLGPEGLLFIAAKDSPTHEPLLVTANEVSGSVSIFAVNDADDCEKMKDRDDERDDDREDDEDRPQFAREAWPFAKREHVEGTGDDDVLLSIACPSVL